MWRTTVPGLPVPPSTLARAKATRASCAYSRYARLLTCPYWSKSDQRTGMVVRNALVSVMPSPFLGGSSAGRVARRRHWNARRPAATGCGGHGPRLARTVAARGC